MPKHQHLTDSQLSEMIVAAHDDLARRISAVQNKLAEEGYCPGEFITFLSTFSAEVAIDAIKYIEHATKMPKQDILQIIIGTILKHVKVSAMTIHTEEYTQDMDCVMH